jgi:hypothetical protein
VLLKIETDYGAAMDHVNELVRTSRDALQARLEATVAWAQHIQRPMVSDALVLVKDVITRLRGGETPK